ncbi:MAG: hypothetical protein KY455_01955 [Euryarchaeota archaeon]|nr:hypothetical protein [Euryarchaeota archaeon]
MTVADAVDPVVLFVLGLLLATLVLFQRWQDTGDRSAYAIGALAAISAPVLATFYLGWLWTSEPEWYAAGWRTQVTGWGLVVFALPFLFFSWRPVVQTGFFAIASQTRIRRIYHGLETSWQYALSTLVAGQLIAVVWAVVQHLAWS